MSPDDTEPEDRHPHDVCEGCGHLRSQHVRMIDRDSCTCWEPWQRPDATKSLPSLRGLSPIDYATELPLRTSAKGSAKDWSSSICPCSGFVPSGLRFRPEDDQDAARLVRQGKRRRTLVPIGEPCGSS